MNVALTLQYFPADADPITVHASTDPSLMLEFRRAVLQEAQERRSAASDDALGLVIEAAEEQRLRRVLDALLPEEAA